MTTLLHSLLLALSFHFFAGVQGQDGKPDAFSVRAKLLSGWRSTPSTAQALEWLRDVDEQQAADFLRQLGELPAAAGNISLAEAHLRSNSARTFQELLVRNSYYSPRIKA